MAFPTINRRATAVSSTTNATSFTPSWTWNTNTAISAGLTTRWYAFVSADGNPTLSTASAGWSKLGQTSDATAAVTGAVFYTETTSAFAASAGPSLQVDSTASEQYSAVLIAITAASGKTLGHLLATAAQGSSTNSDPPAVTNGTGASQDFAVVASRAGDSTTVATAAPTNYTNLQSRAGGGTNGASSNTADRQVTVANAASENPGTFTSATEQWVSYTLAVYEIASSPGNASGAFGGTVTMSALGGGAKGKAAASGSLQTVTVSALGGGAKGKAAVATALGATITMSALGGVAGAQAHAAGAFGSAVAVTALGGGATGRGNGSGSLQTVTVTPLSGGASGQGSASGAFGSAVTVTPLAGTAGAQAHGSGPFGGMVTLSPLGGGATGRGAAAGAFGVTVTLTSLGGAATGKGGATGSLETVTVSSLGGGATGRAEASGSLAAVTVTSLSGTGSGRAAASGSLSGITATSLGGAATGKASVSVSFGGTITVTPLTGQANGGQGVPGDASGVFGATVSLTALTGAATGRGNANASVPAITVTPLGGLATGAAQASGSFGSAIVVSPLGFEVPIIVPEKYIVYPRIRQRIVPVIGRERIVDRPAINRIITARVTSMDSLLTRTWQPRRAGETDYRGVNWKNDLAAGETIVDYDFEPTGLTLVGKSINGTKTIATLTGGVADTMTETVASITTSTGRVLEVLCKMRNE